MSHALVIRRPSFPTTLAMLGFTCLVALPLTGHAFNPNEGIQNYNTPLPSTAPLTGYAPQLRQVQMPAQPLYPEKAMNAISAPLAAPVPVYNNAAPAPVYAAPATTAPAAPMALPPVDPAVAAQAQAIMQSEQQQQGFIAPAPVYSAPPAPVYSEVSAAPAAPIAMAPVAAMPMAPAAPELSDETRTILSGVPAKIDAPKIQTGSAKIDRVTPQVKEALGAKVEQESYESIGLSIKVSRPGLDTTHELNRAYNALMGGDTQTAIETYKNILGTEPNNQEALFGLAATYHRLGMVEKARPYYGQLLKVNPNHREGLNNFLVLVSDESPQDALPELERLEARNPDFSPIPAQTAIVLEKLGYVDASREKMLRAIELAPDNMSYKYNLAVMLDRQGQHLDAIELYRSLIQASLQGAKVPASVESMQKRLNYLTTQMTQARTAAVVAH